MAGGRRREREEVVVVVVVSHGLEIILALFLRLDASGGSSRWHRPTAERLSTRVFDGRSPETRPQGEVDRRCRNGCTGELSFT